MARSPLTRFRTSLHPFVRGLYRSYLNKVWGMDLAPGVGISLSARLDKTYPKGIHIGEDSTVTFGAAILTHDFINRQHRDVWIGKCCFIGANSIILPGVRIGDHCIISAASVVMKDVPSHSLVAGNPGRVMETGIQTGKLGHRIRPPAPPPAAGAPAGEAAAAAGQAAP